jgi:hypothetical protein
MVMICSIAVKLPGNDQMMIYVLFLGQIFFIGLATNAAYNIMDTRTNPKLVAVAFEINLTFATGSTMVLPILAKSPEPTPTILFLIFGLLAIGTLLIIGP